MFYSIVGFHYFLTRIMFLFFFYNVEIFSALEDYLKYCSEKNISQEINEMKRNDCL